MDVFALEELARARVRDREAEVRRLRAGGGHAPSLRSRLADLLLRAALHLDGNVFRRGPSRLPGRNSAGL